MSTATTRPARSASIASSAWRFEPPTSAGLPPSKHLERARARGFPAGLAWALQTRVSHRINKQLKIIIVIYYIIMIF